MSPQMISEEEFALRVAMGATAAMAAVSAVLTPMAILVLAAVVPISIGVLPAVGIALVLSWSAKKIHQVVYGMAIDIWESARKPGVGDSLDKNEMKLIAFSSIMSLIGFGLYAFIQSYSVSQGALPNKQLIAIIGNPAYPPMTKIFSVLLTLELASAIVIGTCCGFIVYKRVRLMCGRLKDRFPSTS